MTTGGVIRAVLGYITWSYYRAGSLTEIVVTRSNPHVACKCARCAEGRWRLQATLVLSDAFKLSRKPLLFVVPTQKGNMVWPITDIEIKDRAVTASLGKPM